MQRQKTIAKWLAIILLLTSIIACYIAFSSIIKNKNALPPDIAGADTDNSGSDADKNPDDNQPQPKPVYSTFPRAAEDINGMHVGHVGGEDNELFLDTLYYAGKRYVFFYSASTQYDVKECGIHIAVFDNATLISTSKIADVDESFVTASIVENGLLVITKNSAQTKLRILNGNLSVICENACAAYSNYKLYVTSASARLYTADQNYLYAHTISSSLEIKRSTFVLPIENGEIFYTAGLGEYDTLFVQSAQGIGCLTYSSSEGFKCRSELANYRLTQVLPNSVNGKPVFTLIAKYNDGIAVVSVDEYMKLNAKYAFKGAKTAVATLSGNNVCVYADKAKAVFCSHLDLQSSTPVNFDGYAENQTYTAIDGENEYFIIAQGNAYQIVKIENDTLISKLKFTGKSVKAIRENIQGNTELSVLFDGNVNNSFANMCFGATDVFYITRFV